ncbi:MAG: beta-N-acetylhexosaminidase [Pseudomonadota bacterium]
MTTVGQLLMVGVEGTKVTHDLELFIKEMNVGGVILFSRNFKSPAQLASFIRYLNEVSESRLIIAVDQEGGRVARLGEPFTKLPPMSCLGRCQDEAEALAKQAGELLGQELRAVGINLNFAPVLDVATNAFNPVIADRAFSSDPNIVAKLGCAFIRGIQSQGIAACAKHFPGHGDTDKDSHLELPVLSHTRARFDALEFIPFKAAIEAGVASIMTSHLKIPNLDDAPVTISRPITTGILRRELNFDGLIFTDDLTMKGITSVCGPREAAWRAVASGADMALVCHNRDAQREALEGLRQAVGEGLIPMGQLSKTLSRIAAFKEKYATADKARFPISRIGCREHRQIARSLESC